jgi:phosphoglycolate phosphatase-like HAD superfamily hydrolase
MTPPTAILDIDGTLVDSNYFHAIAWYRALARNGHVAPLWQVHRHIGMGSDQLVAAVCGEDVEREEGDAIREAEGELYFELIDEVAPLAGARELIVDLKERGCPVVLASSATPKEVDHYLDLLDARELADSWTTAGDVENTKPAPDLVTSAIEKVEGDGPAVMIGDSTFDCEAAAAAGVDTIAVLTGGFSDAELLRAGATIVFHSIVELRERLAWTPLG